MISSFCLTVPLDGVGAMWFGSGVGVSGNVYICMAYERDKKHRSALS